MREALRSRVRPILYAALPLLFLLIFYWPGLTIYFYQDDFGWLNLRHEVRTWADIPAALFVPKAHGNLRPWSETGFFLLLSTLFGVNPLPFRICVFLTACGDLLLLGAIVRRITGSQVAAFWTEMLWIANSCVAVAACWTSIYNQFQYVFFILAAFYFFLRGRYRWQWIFFLLGFGSLEVMVMYPALAALYALLFARPLLKKTLPMFGGFRRVLGAALRGREACVQRSLRVALRRRDCRGRCGRIGGWRSARTGWRTSTWSMRVWPRPPRSCSRPRRSCSSPSRIRRRDWLPVFALGWFVILLAPLIPLRDHISDYYLTGPAIGLALFEGLAIQQARRAAIPVGLLLLALSIPAARATVLWHHARGEGVEDLVLGVEQIRQQHPGKTILLTGVRPDVFYAGVDAVPFLALDIPSVYLAPGSEANIPGSAERVRLYELPEGLARTFLDENRAVVYDASTAMLRNVTSIYHGLWQPGPPDMINLGDAAFESQLSGEWLPVFNGYRRMGGRGTVASPGRSRPARNFTSTYTAPKPHCICRLKRGAGTWTRR